MIARTTALALCWVLLPAAAQELREVSPRLRQLLEARDYTEAEQAIRQGLARSPDWDTGHLLLAQIYLQTGRFDLAEQSAASATRIRESLDGLMLLATATMRLNRLNDSIGWLEKAARRRPDYPEIYKMLGLDYALGGALRESEQALRRAVELAPGNWEYQYLRGRALFELGRIQEAAASLLRAVELNRASAKAWTALGQVQERRGENDAAETSYRKALEACGAGHECAWPLLQLGFLYNVRSGPAQAAAWFRRAVAARPDWARPHFYLGKALAALDDLRGARGEFEQAVKLDESRSEYHYQLAQVYRQLGEVEKAGVQLARFRSLADLESNATPSAEFAQP